MAHRVAMNNNKTTEQKQEREQKGEPAQGHKNTKHHNARQERTREGNTTQRIRVMVEG